MANLITCTEEAFDAITDNMTQCYPVRIASPMENPSYHYQDGDIFAIWVEADPVTGREEFWVEDYLLAEYRKTQNYTKLH